ncbi:hypothetical protein QUA42_12850 [Microcoleus sp. Pol11C2]|uniref:hypothetical protein n=1 Tax=Microcoleus sp. Pol11C2 TaxID=3055389 RepID=UPI002FCF619E
MRSGCAIGNYLAPSSDVAWVRRLWQPPDSAQRIKIALSAQGHLNFTVNFDKTHIWHHSQEQARCLFHKE